MTTLIHCQGAGAGRCDAKCYNATSPHCDCVCGGMNHGVGREQAQDNTRELAGELLEDVKAKGGWIAPELAHPDLFA